MISKSQGLKMTNILKPNAVPTIFKNRPPQTKMLKRHDKNISQDTLAGQSKHVPQPAQGVYRKREAARVCLERN